MLRLERLTLSEHKVMSSSQELVIRCFVILKILLLASCKMIPGPSTSDQMVEYCEQKGSSYICTMIPKAEMNRILRGQ